MTEKACGNIRSFFEAVELSQDLSAYTRSTALKMDRVTRTGPTMLILS